MSRGEKAFGISRPKVVEKMVLAKPQHEGDGAVARRIIGRSFIYCQDLISKFN